MTPSPATRHALRILIVRIGAMGDILHALPAVSALRAALPAAFIGWAIEPRWQALLASATGSPVVDRLHLVPTREWKQRPLSLATLRQLATLRREMQAEHYDLAVDLQGSIKSAVVGRLAGPIRFAGPRRPRERQARALYGERFETRAVHVVAQACELLSAATGTRLTPAAVKLPFDPAAEAWCDAAVPRIAAPTILLAPTAGWGAKQWPAAHYAALAETLTRQGNRVLLNLADADDPIAARIPGARPLYCTIARLIALTRRADLVLGGDTGPVHLAAALGRPTVALFGPTDPARNGPEFPGAQVRVLRHPESRLSHKRLDETEAGLARISVAEVLTAAQALLTESVHA